MNPGCPVLHAILDADTALRAGWAPTDLAAAFVRGGARFIQIRAKSLPSGDFLDLIEATIRVARPAGVTVIVNDRVDLAMMSAADGAHVGQDDLPPAEARRLLGNSAVIGYSTHSVDQIDDAVNEPLSYLAVGPVFGTRTKDTGYDAVGLDLVRTAARLARTIPIVAIGGITIDNAAAALEAGAAAVAVISDLLASGDPEERVRRYVNELGDGRRRTRVPPT